MRLELSRRVVRKREVRRLTAWPASRHRLWSSSDSPDRPPPRLPAVSARGARRGRSALPPLQPATARPWQRESSSRPVEHERTCFLPGRSRPGHSSSRLSIGVEMPREGCLPDEELRRAMARALRAKTPKAESWRRRNPRCECWLACVDRIGTCLFEDTRDTVIAGWRASLSIPDVWDRLILFPMTHLTRRAAGVVPVDVLHRVR